MSASKVLRRDRFTAIMLLLGIAVALLSTLESNVSWIASFCGFLGDGCHDTARYRLFGFPIAPWGIIYYALLGLIYLRRPSWLFWSIAIGTGFEAVLVRIMITDRIFCIFCAVNCILIALLYLRHLNRERTWKMLSLTLLSFITSSLLISGFQTETPAHNQSKSSATILANAGGSTITAADVDTPIATEIHKLQQQIYAMEHAVLETQINDLLLKKEAMNQGVSFDELLVAIRGQIATPAAHIVDHYYDSGLYRSWGAWDGTKQEIKAKISAYLHQRDSTPLVLEYCQKLREKYPVEIFLKPPPLPLTQVYIDGAPSQGPDDALVTIVEFSDYLCPSCRKGHDTVKRIKEKYDGQIRWIFKDYPLDRHPGAKQLALAARSADKQGKFWEYQELLFSTKKSPNLEEAIHYASELGMDTALFQQSMSDPILLEELEQDVVEARKAGISSTPTFIINGSMRTGTPSFDEFSKLIDQALHLDLR
jgi:protein-disulfide isomerase